MYGGLTEEDIVKIKKTYFRQYINEDSRKAERVF